MNLKTTAALIGTLVLPMAVMAQNVAVVNGKPVPKARVDALLKMATHGGAPEAAPPEMQSQARDQIVIREIFAQAAEKAGVMNTPEYKSQLELARQTVLINTLFQQYEKAHPIPDSEVRAQYDQAKAANGQEFHAHHILVDKEDDAKKLIAQIKAGGKFEDIAKKESKDTESAEKGGELDWSPAGQYVPEFGAALQALKPGQLTDTPVHTQYGYHIIRLDETRAAKFPSFDEVKDRLKQQHMQAKLQEYQDQLRKAAKTDYKFAADEAPAAPQGAPAAPAAKQ